RSGGETSRVDPGSTGLAGNEGGTAGGLRRGRGRPWPGGAYFFYLDVTSDAREIMAEFLKDKRRWLAENRMALLAILVIGLAPFLGFLTSSGQALHASDQIGAPAWRFYFESLRQGV